MKLGSTSLAVIGFGVALTVGAESQTSRPAASQDRNRPESTLLARIAAQPDDATAYLDLAKLYYREERYEEAAKMSDAATAIFRHAKATTVPRVRESLAIRAAPITPVNPKPPPPITPPAIAAQGLIEPRKILHVMPIYPESARTAGIQGIVVIDAIVDRDGNVTDPRVVQSIPLLDDAALAAVRQWKYRPTRIDGVAVPFAMTLTVMFGLR